MNLCVSEKSPASSSALHFLRYKEGATFCQTREMNPAAFPPSSKTKLSGSGRYISFIVLL